jgi:putative oxidoreductase
LRIFELTLQADHDGIDAAIVPEKRGPTIRTGAGMKKLPRTISSVLSIFLAVVFIAVGLSKLEGSSATRWTQRFLHWGYPAGSQYVVGAIETLGGIAIVIPRWRKAAAGILIVVMAGALYTHARNGEFPRVIPPLVLGSLAFVVFFLHSLARASSK